MKSPVSTGWYAPEEVPLSISTLLLPPLHCHLNHPSFDALGIALFGGRRSSFCRIFVGWLVGWSVMTIDDDDMVA